MVERQRFLKAASGDLYNINSKAYHWALEQLRDLLLDIGFTVNRNRKVRPEATLRVYSKRSRQYPLLNPYFGLATAELRKTLDTECIEVRVLSHADDGSIDRQLETFASTPACTFHAGFPSAIDKPHYRYHGSFILPLRFAGEPRKQEIDFRAVRVPLTQIFAFLQPVGGQASTTGVSKETTVVADPSQKRVFGEIPGVPIGTVFATREELSRAGVHRPLQAGISGSEGEGADSIVLSGGYEDDNDEGDIIIYTGHGGRDPASGRQIRDQQATRGNLALMKNQTEGLPVRVVRGADPKSHFAPGSGYRYDGLYRVEDSWSEPGRSGFNVLQFRLVKDQGTPISQGKPGAVGPADRRSMTVQRVVRDTALGRRVKVFHGYACQVCGLILEGPAGPYAEAAHIRPLGHPHDGPDALGNLLCLCPNHHVLFDLRAFTVRDDLSLDGIEGKLTVKDGHPVEAEHLLYRREHYAPLPEKVTDEG